VQVGFALQLHEALALVLEFACVSGMAFRILWPPRQIVQAARLRDFVETIRDLLRAPFCDVAAFLVVELPVVDEATDGLWSSPTIVLQTQRCPDTRFLAGLRTNVWSNASSAN